MDTDDLTGEVAADDRRFAIRSPMARDGAALLRFWRRLSSVDRRRFLDFERIDEREVASAATSPGGTVLAVVGFDDDRVVGIGRLERVGPDAARFWVVVDHGWRGVGVGTALVRRLADDARAGGVATMVGDVPPGDAHMLGLLSDLGLEYRQQVSARGVLATVELRETEEYLERGLAERREAVRTTLQPLLAPRSIAVVGASDNRESIGGLLWSNLVASGFDGAMYPVNPAHRLVQGTVAMATLSDCPTRPDLVVICTPAVSVLSIVEEAGALGLGAVCVISAGFAEVGAEGLVLQRQVVSTARRHGLRLLGPNCMGLLSGDAPRFNATFSRAFPPKGRLSFVSQSGALGLAALALLDDPQLGIHAFVSVGNAADVSATDVLLYWDDDPETDAILLYLESVPEPPTFGRVARHVSRHKPIVAVKAGRSSAGRRAAASHTAALAAGDVAVQALVRQAGIIRVDTLEELFDVATVLADQPSPSGRRVGILTNGGGPGILVADTCHDSGLLVPELSTGTQRALRDLLPAGASVLNPVDMVATAGAAEYRRCLELLLADDVIDAVIVIFIPPFLTRPADVAREIAAVATSDASAKPIIASFMSADTPPPALAAARVPNFPYPERAASALGRVATWSEWRAEPAGRVVLPDGIDRARARRILTEAVPGAGGWLGSDDTGALLASYGIPMVASRLVGTPEEAAGAATELGCPVVVKLAAPIHKTDVGGVLTGIETAEDAAAAVVSIRAGLVGRTSGYGDEFIVQQQVTDGVEMLVGVSHDPAFGPLVAVGLGGTLVEAVGDVALRMTPLTDRDVESMLRSLKAYRLLSGYRGGRAADVDALKDVVYRIAAMAEDLPTIAEADVNPVFVRADGAVVVDARIRVTGDGKETEARDPGPGGVEAP